MDPTESAGRVRKGEDGWLGIYSNPLSAANSSAKLESYTEITLISHG